MGDQGAAVRGYAGPADFVLTDSDFDRIRELVRDHTGITLSDAKRQLVYGRLVRRLRALGLSGFGDYVKLLDRDESVEIEEFTNAVTTNLTSFFREAHHFDYLASHVLPGLLQRDVGTRRLRIWSSACSTGEEPYSIAMVLREQAVQLAGFDTKVLATDLDSKVLATAVEGVYDAERLKTVSAARIKNFFHKGVGATDGKARVVQQLRDLITFKHLNLMHPWPMRGPLDVIFCRNVIIYFDKATQRELFERMANMQRPGDVLFLGHSESLYRVTEKYDLVGRTIYRRNAT